MLRFSMLVLILICKFVATRGQVQDNHLHDLENRLNEIKDSIEVANICVEIYDQLKFINPQYNPSEADYLVRALRIYEANEKWDALAYVFNALGGMYYNRKQYGLAEKYWLKAIEYYKKADNTTRIAVMYNNISLVYSSDSDSRDIEKAKEYLEKALEVYIRLGDSLYISSTYLNLGSWYRAENDLNEAQSFYLQGLEVAKATGRITTQQVALYHLGLVEKDQGNYNSAIRLIEEALSYNSIRRTDPNVLDAYIHLSESYESIGEFEKAINALKEVQQIKDTLYDISINEKLLTLTTEYESEKKELKIAGQQADIDLLAAENQLKNLWLVIIGVSILIVPWIIYLVVTRRFARKEVKLEQEFSENIVRGIENERKRIASELHDSVGQNLLLLKSNFLLQNSQVDQEELIGKTLEEVRAISHALHPFHFEELGLKRSIENTIEGFNAVSEVYYSSEMEEANTGLSVHEEIHLYRMVQECLNNVEKHAQASACKVSMFRNGKFIVTIEDNGVGFNHNSVSEKQTSLGMKTIRERAKIIGAKVAFTSGRRKGSKVEIKLQ